MATYLITGASRGLGLDLTKKVLASGGNVIAGARKPSESKELAALQSTYSKTLTIVALDVDNTKSVQAAAQQVTSSHPQGIDYLINNAGIVGPGIGDVDDFAVYNTNIAGPLRVINAFIPLVKKGNKKIVLNISSLMGSIASQYKIHDFVQSLTPGNDFLNYRISKAGLNAAVVALAAMYKNDGISFVAIHPGLVQTDLARSLGADPTYLAKNAITPDTSATNVLKVLHKLTFEDSAKFYNHDGSEFPW